MSTVVRQNHTQTSAATLHLKLPANTAEIDRTRNQVFEFLETPPKESTAWAPKSSFSAMSARSLQLCTENLGSETGCEFVPVGDFFSSAPPAPILSNSTNYSNKRAGIDNSKRKQMTRLPKTRNHNFPPPLTSSLRVRRHTEGGRLIMEAVDAPFGNSYMKADRSDGRLRLCFLTVERTTSPAVEEEAIETAAEEEVEAEKEESEKEKFQWTRRCQERGSTDGSKWKPAQLVAIS